MFNKSEIKIMAIITICIFLFAFLFVIYFDDNRKCCFTNGYEEDPRPRGGSFLEFDHERNILLIGEKGGLGLYDPSNNTYKIIRLDDVTGVAIDYIHDIYYISTHLDGIKKYFVNNNTLINNPLEFQEYKYAYQLAFDEHNNNLVICLPPSLTLGNFFYQFKNNESIIFDKDEERAYTRNNSAYYSRENKMLFIFNQHQHLLQIINFNNKSKSINVELNKTIFIESRIKNVDIVYDPNLEIVFLGMKSGKQKYIENVTKNLVIYDLNTNNFSYLYVPKYHYSYSTVYDICINYESHKLYIGTERGLHTYNINNNKFKRIGSIHHRVKSLVFDHESNMLYYSYLTNTNSPIYYLNSYNANNGTIKEIN